MSGLDLFAESVLWQSGLGFLSLGAVLTIELFLHRRGFAQPDVEHDDSESTRLLPRVGSTR